ncbi:hypothetical protein [Crocinitomix catalasitica]|uniref:hypothetical protein n=1 Tax=Crocinitomix catalasitica TaxID=184607 RepID=UPI000484C33A|nr:hypothetical protein [Crocinitomix catalasitica]
MNEDFINIAVNNVLSIYNSPGQNLHKSKFKTDFRKSIPVEDIIEFLVNSDFIETDRHGDDTYFLNHETYDLIETNNLEDAIRYQISSNEGEDLEIEETEPRLTLDEINALNIQIKNQNKDQKKNTRTLIIGVSITITIVSYYVRLGHENKAPVRYGIEQMDLKNISIDLQTQIDSLVAEKTRKNTEYKARLK